MINDTNLKADLKRNLQATDDLRDQLYKIQEEVRNHQDRIHLNSTKLEKTCERGEFATVESNTKESDSVDELLSNLEAEKV